MALWPELSLVAGDAVAAALRAETGVAAELSHPNDVLVGVEQALRRPALLDVAVRTSEASLQQRLDRAGGEIRHSHLDYCGRGEDHPAAA
jgi:biotin-(acetyl-CoA carboxylase) ligase